MHIVTLHGGALETIPITYSPCNENFIFVGVKNCYENVVSSLFVFVKQVI